MGIFGDSSSPFDECIEKVTAEHLTTENWAMILDVCDKVNSDPRAPKNAILSIRKRLNHRDPHVVLLALSVLDSCWSNCGPAFRKEVSSASFISELQSKAVHVSPYSCMLMFFFWSYYCCSFSFLLLSQLALKTRFVERRKKKEKGAVRLLLPRKSQSFNLCLNLVHWDNSMCCPRK
ncbi:VHS domain protein [Ancylostoma duodenale]|uniref:VHS domain protein n=1 Tax=Ancylostoma duodenale TaxID=51022 RepID=A0A0C2D8M3_9BILA|nr:VHS domain protein [Ancylostoma duodenale]